MPLLPTATTPGAMFTLDGLCSGTAVSDEPAELSCIYDENSHRWTYSVTTSTAQQFSGVDNYPTVDYYHLSVILPDEPQQDGGITWAAQIVIAFADSTGTYVQMYAPDNDSLVVDSAPDRSAVAFSMINAAKADRHNGSPTTAVGTITCPR